MRKPLSYLAPLLLLMGCGANQAPQQSFEQRSQSSPTAAAATTQVTQPSPQGAPVTQRQLPFAPGNAAPAQQAAPAAARLGEMTIPAGTPIRVRLAETLNTERNKAGDRFTATLDAPIEIAGQTAVPKGVNVTGHVTTADASGRLKGRAVLGVTLDSLQVNGKTYRIATTSASRVSASHKKRNLVLIGGGSGLGAALGAVAGGGKGALIGAGAGAAAGTAGAAATGKRNVTLPVETPLSFKLRAPVTI